jgi:alanine dehydrogenase
VDDVLHYCVANMPGAVPFTSTLALTNATLPYAVQIADKGYVAAAKGDREILLGLNIINGKIVYQGVAEAFGMPYTPVEKVLP